MKLLAFSVHDSKAEAFMRPFFAETKGLAVRSFKDACNDPQQEVCKHAEDYTLFHIGAFDQVSGMLVPLASPVAVGTAITFKETL